MTPPDTASECALSDCPDMSAQAWSQASLPEESWRTAPAPGNSTMMQSTGNDWHHGAPITTQELQALDASSWLNVSQGPVDMGLSPVLSQESQNTHSLGSISEPEIPLLPPGLDLSFISEPSWDPSAPVIYSSAGMNQEGLSYATVSPQHVSIEGPLSQGYGLPQSAVSDSHSPMDYFQGPHAPYPRRTASDPSVFQGRPILPRSDGVPASARVQYTAIESRYPHVGAPETARVSNTDGRSKAPMEPAQRQGPPSRHYRASPLSHGSLSPRPDTVPPTRMSGPYASHPSDDFSNFIRYDQEDKTTPVNNRSDAQP